jgi:hypothetical protein
MAKEKNLIIRQGETFLESVTVTNTDGSAFDLTNQTIVAQMRPNYREPVYQDLHPIAADDPTTGIFTLNLVNLETAALKAGRWVYNASVTDNGTGFTITVLFGIVTVYPSAINPVDVYDVS